MNLLGQILGPSLVVNLLVIFFGKSGFFAAHKPRGNARVRYWNRLLSLLIVLIVAVSIGVIAILAVVISVWDPHSNASLYSAFFGKLMRNTQVFQPESWSATGLLLFLTPLIAAISAAELQILRLTRRASFRESSPLLDRR